MQGVKDMQEVDSLPTTGMCEPVQYTSLEALETALSQPPLSAWSSILDADPTATLFQSPMWTLPWYRAYDTTFQPYVLAVIDGGELVGVAPMAVERETGHIAFAGDGMADYRDIVAKPGYREQVVTEFLKMYRDGSFRNMLWLGPTLPESETVDTVLRVNTALETPAVRRLHYGWRWWVSERAKIEDPLKKKAVRYALNYFRRQGPVTVKTIDTESEWDEFKEHFYNQHSLRQRYGGRGISFDDVRKRAFVDALFRTPCRHVTALYVNGRMIASHVGCVYRNVLLWGAPAFDIREKPYSPGLLLMVLTMQEAENWGLKGVDLTIGEGDLKERFSTSRVDLPSVELHPSQRRYLISKARVSANLFLREKVAQYGGEDAWNRRVRPVLKSVSQKVERFRELGLAGTLLQAGRRVLYSIGERATGLVLIAKPGAFHRVNPALQTGETCSFHENEFYDLLKWSGTSRETDRAITLKARQITDLLKSGRTLHTVLVNDRLAGWGLSYWPKPNEPAHLSETGGTVLEFPPHSVTLYDFYTLPEYRGRKLYQALLSHILDLRFKEGAERAYIGVLKSNRSSLAGIEKVGFARWMVNRYHRLFKWKRTRTRYLQGDR